MLQVPENEDELAAREKVFGPKDEHESLREIRDLPSAKIFAECQISGTRQRPALGKGCLCRVPGTRQRQPLPSVIFCRVRRSAKQVFAECPKFGTRQRF